MTYGSRFISPHSFDFMFLVRYQEATRQFLTFSHLSLHLQMWRRVCKCTLHVNLQISLHVRVDMRCDFLFDSYAFVLKLHRTAVCARRERSNRFVRRHLRPPTNLNRDTMTDRRQADQEVDIAAWRLYRFIRDPYSGGIDREEHPGFAASPNYKRALEAAFEDFIETWEDREHETGLRLKPSDNHLETFVSTEGDLTALPAAQEPPDIAALRHELDEQRQQYDDALSRSLQATDRLTAQVQETARITTQMHMLEEKSKVEADKHKELVEAKDDEIRALMQRLEDMSNPAATSNHPPPQQDTNDGQPATDASAAAATPVQPPAASPAAIAPAQPPAAPANNDSSSSPPAAVKLTQSMRLTTDPEFINRVIAKFERIQFDHMKLGYEAFRLYSPHPTRDMGRILYLLLTVTFAWKRYVKAHREQRLTRRKGRLINSLVPDDNGAGGVIIDVVDFNEIRRDISAELLDLDHSAHHQLVGLRSPRVYVRHCPHTRMHVGQYNFRCKYWQLDEHGYKLPMYWELWATYVKQCPDHIHLRDVRGRGIHTGFVYMKLIGQPPNQDYEPWNQSPNIRTYQYDGVREWRVPHPRYSQFTAPDVNAQGCGTFEHMEVDYCHVYAAQTGRHFLISIPEKHDDTFQKHPRFNIVRYHEGTPIALPYAVYNSEGTDEEYKRTERTKRLDQSPVEVFAVEYRGPNRDRVCGPGDNTIAHIYDPRRFNMTFPETIWANYGLVPSRFMPGWRFRLQIEDLSMSPTQDRPLPARDVIEKALCTDAGALLPAVKSFTRALAMLQNNRHIAFDGETGSGKTSIMAVLNACFEVVPRTVTTMTMRSALMASSERTVKILGRANPTWVVDEKKNHSASIDAGVTRYTGQVYVRCSVDRRFSIRDCTPTNVAFNAYIPCGEFALKAMNDPKFLRGLTGVTLDELHERGILMDILTLLIHEECFRRIRDGEPRLMVQYASATGIVKIARKLNRVHSMGQTVPSVWNEYTDTVTPPPTYKYPGRTNVPIATHPIHVEHVGGRPMQVHKIYPTQGIQYRERWRNWTQPGLPPHGDVARQTAIFMGGVRSAGVVDNQVVHNDAVDDRPYYETLFATVIFVSGSGIADKLAGLLRGIFCNGRNTNNIPGRSKDPATFGSPDGVRWRNNSWEYEIVILDSYSPKDVWDMVKDPEPGKSRRDGENDRHIIIIATNVAQSSITMPGVRNIICTCWEWVSWYNPELGCMCGRHEICGPEEIEQQLGRVGRVALGVAYLMIAERILFPAVRRYPFFSDRKSNGPKMIMTATLANRGTMPRLVDLKDETAQSRDGVGPGDDESEYVAIFIRKTETLSIYLKSTILFTSYMLAQLGMFNEKWEFTPLGHITAAHGIDPRWAKSIFAYPVYDPRRLIAIICSVLQENSKSVFASAQQIAIRMRDRHEAKKDIRARAIIDRRDNKFRSINGPTVAALEAFMHIYWECIILCAVAKQRRINKTRYNQDYSDWDAKHTKMVGELSVYRGEGYGDEHPATRKVAKRIHTHMRKMPAPNNDPIDLKVKQKTRKGNFDKVWVTLLTTRTRDKSYPFDEYGRRPRAMPEFNAYTPNIYNNRLVTRGDDTVDPFNFEMNLNRDPLPMRQVFDADHATVNNLPRAGEAVPVIPCAGGEYRLNGPFVSHHDVDYTLGDRVFADIESHIAVAITPDLFDEYEFGNVEAGHFMSAWGITASQMSQVWDRVLKLCRGRGDTPLAYITSLPRTSDGVRAVAKKMCLDAAYGNIAHRAPATADQIAQFNKSPREPVTITASGLDVDPKDGANGKGYYGDGPYVLAGNHQVAKVQHREGYNPALIEMGSYPVLPYHVNVQEGHKLPEECYLVFTNATQVDMPEGGNSRNRAHDPANANMEIVQKDHDITLNDFTVFPADDPSVVAQFERARALNQGLREYVEKVRLTNGAIPTGRMPSLDPAHIGVTERHARDFMLNIRYEPVTTTSVRREFTERNARDFPDRETFDDMGQVRFPSEVAFGRWTRVNNAVILDATTHEETILSSWRATASPENVALLDASCVSSRNDDSISCIMTPVLEPNHMLIKCSWCNAGLIWPKNEQVTPHVCADVQKEITHTFAGSTDPQIQFDRDRHNRLRDQIMQPVT